MTDLMEEIEDEWLHQNRRSWDTQDGGIAANLLDRIRTALEAKDDRIAELEAGLLRIGQPGKQIVYCRDGHEEAVLLARAAYLGEKE
jgi:hypothetical protein